MKPVLSAPFAVKTAVAALLLAALGSCGIGRSLDSRPNVGPCPVAGSLYDASRLVEVGEVERHENVGFTGIIDGVHGFCRYVGKDPIDMNMDINFTLGKGPMAQGDSRTYQYFVAVTRRDRTVLAKEVYSFDVKFPRGADIVRHTESVPGIVIPRATETVSGANFEVIVGFELTPEQLAFNRSGKRFLMNVQSAPQAASNP